MSCQKTMIVYLYKNSKSKTPNMPYKQSMNEISRTLGISYNSVCSTTSKHKTTGTVTSPNKKRSKKCLFDKIDDLDKNALRQKVHGFWSRKKLPTINKISEAVNGDPALPDYK